MDSKAKIFVPWGCAFRPKGGIIRLDHYYKHKHYYFKPCKKPFFSILNEDYTPKGFIEAVKKNNNEDAESYLSKALGYSVDLDYVKGIFKENSRCKYIVEVGQVNSGLHKIKSVFVTDESCKLGAVVHFYLIKEPDGFSNWKIFKIVKETV